MLKVNVKGGGSHEVSARICLDAELPDKIVADKMAMER